MTIELAEMIWLAVGAYFGVGLVIGLGFVFFGAHRLDHAAEGSGPLFRLIILPGAVGLWPAILVRIFSFRKINAPTE
ncbi:MAG: hypothetical protein ACFB6R_15830 [Alphaproteobacteria bacterium]